MKRLLMLPAALLAVTSAIADTPLAHAEIMKYGMPYPGNQYLDLRAVYEPYLRDAGFEKATVSRDLAYGDDPLNTLDVLEPKSASGEAMPIVLFVHGVPA